MGVLRVAERWLPVVGAALFLSGALGLLSFGNAFLDAIVDEIHACNIPWAVSAQIALVTGSFLGVVCSFFRAPPFRRWVRMGAGGYLLLGAGGWLWGSIASMEFVRFAESMRSTPSHDEVIQIIEVAQWRQALGTWTLLLASAAMCADACWGLVRREVEAERRPSRNQIVVGMLIGLPLAALAAVALVDSWHSALKAAAIASSEARPSQPLAGLSYLTDILKSTLLINLSLGGFGVCLTLPSFFSVRPNMARARLRG